MIEHTPGVQDEFDEVVYGFFHLDDPRDFFPDEECCTPAEITAHKTACEKAALGEVWGPVLERGGGCVASESFGIGTYLIHGFWTEAQS